MKNAISEYDKLRAFTQFGVSFSKVHGGQAVGTCPFPDCGRARKFYANVETRKWDCKVCGRAGSLSKFFELIGKVFAKDLRGKPLSHLAKDRGLLRKTLRKWRVGWTGAQYTIPVNGMGRTQDLRRYTIGKKIISASGGHPGLTGITFPSTKRVWICEGEWDAMALYETLHVLKRDETVYALTSAHVWPKKGAELMMRQDVILVFDADDAGIRGENRVFNMLQGFARTIRTVHWPENVPEHYDLRDHYRQNDRDPTKTIRTLERMLKGEPRRLGPQSDGVEVVTTLDAAPDGLGISRGSTIRRYRKWMHLPDPEPLDVMFGTLFANRLDGDPLWLFLVAPPGGSKTELLMSVCDAPLVVAATTLTPATLISGFNTQQGDPSLIPRLNEKVLVIKDFTTILNMHYAARDEIFGTLRAAYDGKIEKPFGNGVFRRYESRFGIMAGVTPIIESYANMSSMLGERFLKYRIRHPGKVRVGTTLIGRVLGNINKETRMRENLAEVAADVLDYGFDTDDPPRLPKKYAKRYIGLAQWVAALRGVVQRERYTGQVSFKPTAEVGTRLAKQLCKLSIGVAIFRRSEKIGAREYRVAVNTARGTAPDRVEEIVMQLYTRLEGGVTHVPQIAKWSRYPYQTVLRIIEDLEMLHVVRKRRGGYGLSKSIVKLMTPLRLYEEER